LSWSTRSFATLASGWAQESAYGEPTSPRYAHETSSPHMTLSHRSLLAPLSRNTRDALDKLYKRVYGHDSRRRLVTQKGKYLEVVHVVQCASSPDQLSLYEYRLGCEWNTFHVNSRRNLVYHSSHNHIILAEIILHLLTKSHL